MAKVDLTITGKNKASAAIKGVTSSIIKSQLAIEGIKIATKVLINVGKQSIELFREQEKQEKQLENVIKSTGMAAGVTAEEVKNMAKAFQDVTNFGDEAILRGQNMLLTFTKIGEDVFPQATEAILNMSEAMGTDLQQQAIQVGKALNDPIQGIAALRRVGVQLSDQQTQSVKDFMAVNDIASAQKVILGELETQFGGTAKAARDTFGGSLSALKNIQGDNLEAFGKIISIVGKDFVNSMIDGQKAINDFLTDSDKIANIGASFEVVKEIFSDLGKEVFGVLKESINDIMDSFKNLTSDMQGTIKASDIIIGAFKLLGIGLTVTIKSIGMLIQGFIDFINVVKEAGKAQMLLFEALINPTKWGEIGGQLKKVGQAFTNMSINMAENTVDLVGGVIEDFARLPQEVKTSADKYAKIFKDKNKEIKDDFNKTQDEILKTVDKGGEERNANTKKWLDADPPTWQDWANNIRSIIANGLGTIKDFQSQALDGMLEKNREWQENNLASTDEWIAAEMERQDVRLLTKQETLNQEIDDLNTQLNQKQTDEDRAAIAKQLKEKQDELKRVKILEEGEKKKEKIRQDAKKKETELKKKQFEENKAWSIAQIWINAASSVMGWWASFASMGIPGVVLAAIMTASTLAMAGVQCFSENVLIKLISGKYKKAKDINIDDIICGDDDSPRYISDLYYGISDMYKIKYNNYEFECTYNHILSFFNNGKILNIELDKYMQNRNKDYKLYRKINNKIHIIDNFNIKYLGKKEFYGFEIDENHLFKIENDLVAHNTGLVASQTFHGQEGGEIPIGTATGDRAVTFMNKGEALLQNQDYKDLVSMARGETQGAGDTFVIEYMEVVANNPLELAEQLIEVRRQERAR